MSQQIALIEQNSPRQLNPAEEVRKRRERREAILRKYQATEEQNGTEEPAVAQMEETTAQENGQNKHHPKIPSLHKMDDDILRLRKAEDDHMFADEHFETERQNNDMFAPMDEAETTEGKSQEEPVRQDKTAEFDMFSDSPCDVVVAPSTVTQLPPKISDAILAAEPLDDSEGYYCPRIGEVLNGRYSVSGVCGKGVFSIVLKAVDMNSPDKRKVAVKVLRNNDAM